MPKRVEITDTEDMLSPKKRKRIQSGPSSGAKPGSSVVMPIKLVDPYEAAVAFEEKESTTRTTEQDMTLFHTTCDKIRKIMGQIEDLKKHPDKNQMQISELRTLAGLHVLSLKKVNRLEKLRLKAARENTHSAKQRVDTFHLTLQNLLYEIVHVRREVNRCLEFRSQDEDISLVTEEEFYGDAPEEISQPEVTRPDAHRRHLARLHWELEQRRLLADSCSQLDDEKRRITERIGTQRRRLADLAPQLATILQSTRGVQQELSLPLDRRRHQHRLAALLPQPLYVLYVQTAGYAEACDPHMSATICGNEEDAVALKQSESRDTGDDSESGDDPEPEEEGHRKKRHRKTGRDEVDLRVKKLLHKHPLLVVVEVVIQDLGRLVLEFVYLTQLRIITVSVAILDCASAGPLLSAESLLDHLEPGDSGSAAPSAATQHQLRRAGLAPLHQYVAAGKLGKPYLWAQRLAGLDFIAAVQEWPAVSESVSALHVECTVQKIRCRLKARVALQGQLTVIAGGELQLPDALQSRFPSRRDSRLTSWRAITAETYRRSGVLAAALLDDSSSCFMAILSRGGNLQLHCYVAISPQHPLVAPLCGLQLNCAGSQLTASSPTLRALEHDLNVGLPARLGEAGRPALLPALLATTADALDVLAETADGAAAGGHRLMLRKHRGRDRVPPLRYESSAQLFTHGAP